MKTSVYRLTAISGTSIVFSRINILTDSKIIRETRWWLALVDARMRERKRCVSLAKLTWNRKKTRLLDRISSSARTIQLPRPINIVCIYICIRARSTKLGLLAAAARRLRVRIHTKLSSRASSISCICIYCGYRCSGRARVRYIPFVGYIPRQVTVQRSLLRESSSLSRLSTKVCSLFFSFYSYAQRALVKSWDASVVNRRLMHRGSSPLSPGASAEQEYIRGERTFFFLYSSRARGLCYTRRSYFQPLSNTNGLAIRS